MPMLAVCRSLPCVSRQHKHGSKKRELAASKTLASAWLPKRASGTPGSDVLLLLIAVRPAATAVHRFVATPTDRANKMAEWNQTRDPETREIITCRGTIR